MPLDDTTATTIPRPPLAGPRVYGAASRALAPRKAVRVSEWADENRILSAKGSAESGRWRTDRNPPTKEPMDCLSTMSSVRDVCLMWPIQFAKTEVAVNLLGYVMCVGGGPIMVCLPGETSLNKWVAQKLQPMIDESPAVRERLTSVASREAANSRTFKDFQGGQLYIEHAGSPARLKSTSARWLVVDEFDEFAANFTSGDDPGEMLDGRTSAYPNTYKRLYISSPQTKGTSRIEGKWLISDQRRYFVRCPHCDHEQHLQWSGLKWSAHRHPEHGRRAWYVCQECGAEIEEHHKTEMIAAGRWLATNPEGRIRGYHINCLYYQIGLGPRWADLVEMWLNAQGDAAKRKTFINDRLAEPWEDETTRRVQHQAIADRAEDYPLRTAPMGVLCITAGIDTQDNRLAVQLVGWGRGMAMWVLDYVEIYGDPSGDEVWHALTTLLTQPIQHASGATLRVEGMAQDAAGHKTEDVKAYVRGARMRGVQRPLCIFGATQNNAPVLRKGSISDVNWRGQIDRQGLQTWQVGTVAAKSWLYGRISLDAKHDEKHLQDLQTEEAAARSAARATKPIEPPVRMCHFSSQLPDGYFTGLTSETFNPNKNRYEKKRGGVRNEALDTWVYAFAAAHHPELRLHRYTAADWERREVALMARAAALGVSAAPATEAEPSRTSVGSPEPDGSAGESTASAQAPVAPVQPKPAPAPAPAPAAERPAAALRAAVARSVPRRWG